MKMKHASDIDPDVQILKQHIERAAGDLERQESGLGTGLGSLIYLGNHQDAIPRNLLLDPLLESGEIYTLALLKIQLVNPTLPSSIPRQDELMEVLKCSRPVLSRHLQVLRAMRWITLCVEVRGRNHPAVKSSLEIQEGSITEDSMPHSPANNSSIEWMDGRKLDPRNHVKSFYTVNSNENPENHRVKTHVNIFYMAIRSSSSSYINTTTHRLLNFPKAIKSERERLYAAKLLHVLKDERQQQFALDYLTDRISAGEQGTDKPVGNAIRYLDWIVKRIQEGTLPESTYGLRQPKNTQTQKSPEDEEVTRKREHEAWLRSLREKGIEIDPHTGLPQKRNDQARG